MSQTFEISASDEVFSNQEISSPSVSEDAISAPKLNKQAKPKDSIGPVTDGAIGVAVAKDKPKRISTSKKKKSVSETAVAVYSTKNVSWPEIGKISRGYNILEKDVADKWLTRNHVRMVEPEELAREFGVK